MKILLLLTASILLPPGLHAQQPQEPTDLIVLRASWTKARQQAITPIDQKYLQALEALKLKYTRAGQLHEALAIDAEMKSMVVSPITKAAEPAAAEKQDYPSPFMQRRLDLPHPQRRALLDL